jgi:hypothetical protein
VKYAVFFQSRQQRFCSDRAVWREIAIAIFRLGIPAAEPLAEAVRIVQFLQRQRAQLFQRSGADFARVADAG